MFSKEAEEGEPVQSPSARNISAEKAKTPTLCLAPSEVKLSTPPPTAQIEQRDSQERNAIRSNGDHERLPTKTSEEQPQESSGITSTCEPDPETPLPRLNTCLAMKGNELLIYGGLVELGNKELTLDDCWTINLNTR